MNKTELIAKLSDKTGASNKDAKAFLEAAIEVLRESVKSGEGIQLVGVGSLTVKMRGERVARNPKTGDNITIPATKVPVFKPSKDLKTLANS